MKKINFNNTYWITALSLLILAACTDDIDKPTLNDSSTFAAPVLKNAATKPGVELLPENAAVDFEKFEWERAKYGIQLSTQYVLEIDKNEDFSSPQILAESVTDSTVVSVENLNDAMLTLGLPAFQESTFYLRIKSSIVGIENTPLYSQKITRTATTYQTSECGNFCSIGIIGDATAGGWDIDTDLRLADPTKVDKSTWTTTLYLIGGNKVKFRASDDWADNWGGPTFASGTGIKNGSDIVVPASGYYKVSFNDQTGAYTFTAQTTPEYPTVGIIGSGTPGGWDTDTDLTKDPTNPHVWTGTITFTEGEAKFRANNAWEANWGSNIYPSGVGVKDGANIPVKAGTYAVRFNDATGEYAITPTANAGAYATVGIIGTAQSGKWDSDTDLIKNPTNPFLWSKIITISEGEAKFRADNAWDMNWGGSSFPGGVGTKDGPNIPTRDGKYFITFNSGTGEYYFLK